MHNKFRTPKNITYNKLIEFSPHPSPQGVGRGGAEFNSR
jgi:hypothetical protein